MPSPARGTWRYQVTVNDPAVEFFAAASEPTPLTARLRIGDTSPGEDGSWLTPIRVWIAEESAVLGAEVMATIRRPDKWKFSEVLGDEGISADGGDGDGVYGTLLSNTLSGPYSVDVVISGLTSTGEPFERFLSGAFVVPGEPDSPGQVGEGGGDEKDQVTKFCGGPAWCCWRLRSRFPLAGS